jgi:hypothetical protein
MCSKSTCLDQCIFTIHTNIQDIKVDRIDTLIKTSGCVVMCSPSTLRKITWYSRYSPESPAKFQAKFLFITLSSVDSKDALVKTSAFGTHQRIVAIMEVRMRKG